MPKPLIIGHRGASRSAPENTMAAFRLALEAGADGVEFDVRLTRDGIPVIIHDDDLRRTGGTPSRVADLTLHELQAIDVGRWFPSNKFIGEQVPTLHQLFELFDSNDFLLYLEMKCDTTEQDRLAQVCAQVINSSSLKHRVIVESFDLAGIAKIKAIDPTIKTAALFEPSLANLPLITSGQRLVERALAVGADEIALHHRLANDRMVEASRVAGLAVVVWTVDNPSWIARANSTGVTALITNDPALMVRQRDVN